MRKLVLAFCWTLASALPLAAQADYPDRPIKLIVPFPAGSGTDTVARELAEEMAKDLRQPIVVDNKPGAQGIIGVNAAVDSPPDGYTLVMLGVTTGASNVTLFKKLPYDPIHDLTPIGMIAESPIVLVAAPQFGPNNTKELFELGHKEPGKLTYAYGSGSAQVAAAKLVDMGSIETVGVAYKGSPQALTDVMSRQVDFMFVDLSLAIPQIQGGKLKALGVTTASRFSVVPDIPAINESGAPGYQLVVWFALGGPAGMPKPVVDRLSESLKQALDSKKLQGKYANHGLEVKVSTPDEFGEFLKSEITNWGGLIRKAGITPQG
ncbi:tripartite tricarboxylate transporter substrate binding protein [Bordetella sp. BOR01]|uniref:Bug family tripartite tricarboxylate transporter substrate binding protein n=1 Tax=Bordetella sp. BOR01 TaxID=2854779 RepID=UPI001C440C2F|nr:tripartite tricarboxylate transporter substrate binding protein [Bordetella sp. BOR01]